MAATTIVLKEEKTEAVVPVFPEVNSTPLTALPYSKTLNGEPRLTPVADILPDGQEWSRTLYRLKRQHSERLSRDSFRVGNPISLIDLQLIMAKQTLFEDRGAFILRESKHVGQFMTIRSGSLIPSVVYTGLTRFEGTTEVYDRQKKTKEMHTASYYDHNTDTLVATLDGSGRYICSASKMMHLPNEDELDGYDMPATVRKRIAKPTHQSEPWIVEGMDFPVTIYRTNNYSTPTSQETIIGASYGSHFLKMLDITPCFLDSKTFQPVETKEIYAKEVTWRLYDQKNNRLTIELLKSVSDEKCETLRHGLPVVFPSESQSHFAVIPPSGAAELLEQNKIWPGRPLFISHRAETYLINDPKSNALYLSSVSAIDVIILFSEKMLQKQYSQEDLVKMKKNNRNDYFLNIENFEFMVVNFSDIEKAELDIVRNAKIIETPRRHSLIDLWMTDSRPQRRLVFNTISKLTEIAQLQNIARLIEDRINKEQKITPSMASVSLKSAGVGASMAVGGLAMLSLFNKAVVLTGKAVTVSATGGATLGGVTGSVSACSNRHYTAASACRKLLDIVNDHIDALQEASRAERGAGVSTLRQRHS